jgi:hypothetical protein
MTNDNDNAYIPLSQRTEAELIRQLGELEANMASLEDKCESARFEMSFLELTTLNALATNRSLYIRELDSRTFSASV